VAWPLSAYMDVTIGWRATCFVWAVAHLVIGLPINLLLPPGRKQENAAPDSAAEASPNSRLWLMAGLSFVFAATWFCSTAMAAHLPRVLQEAGASLAVAVAASALIGPAQVGARVLEFWLMRHVHPIMSARIASLAHPVGAASLIAVGAPAAMPFAVIHGAGNGVMTISMGTLPLALLGAAGYGLRQGLLMAPARLLSASAPFVFDLLLARFGTAALTVTGALGVAAFTVLMLLPVRRKDPTKQ
jgi:predicted MFS family arabinose efflux permease